MSEYGAFAAPAVTSRWRAGGGGQWTTRREEVRDTTEGIRCTWHASFACDIPVPDGDAGELRVSVEIPAVRFWTLHPDRQLRTGDRQPVHPPFPVGRFVVAEQASGVLTRWEFPQSGPLVITASQGVLTVTFTPYNRFSAGLSHWGGHKWTSLPGSLRFEMLADRLPDLNDCVWVEPFPGGALSALCLTDHADYDTEAKQQLLNEQFIRNDVRFTKSVFPSSERHPRFPNKREPGLDSPGFLEQIRELYAHGSEIAFHGIGPRRSAPPADECARRADLMNEFQPVTWIDHGTGDYLFSRKSVLPDGMPLVEFLGPRGVVNYWSYFDYWSNPWNSLPGWAGVPLQHAALDFQEAWRISGNKGLKQAAYLLAQAAKNLFGEPAVLNLRNHPFAPQSWAGLARQGSAMRTVQREPMVIYTQAGSTFLLDLDAPWVFDTVLLNQPALQLRPNLVDGLASSSTLLIVHCYLGACFPHLPGTAIREDKAGQLQLQSAFVENLEHLATLQQSRRLISLPFSELRASLVAFARTRTVHSSAGWRIRTTGPTAVHPVVAALPDFRSHVAGAGQPVRAGDRLLLTGTGA